MSTRSNGATLRISALVDHAVAAQRLHSAQAAHDRASSAWRHFAATHDHDDPAHAEHHQRTMATKAALQGANADYLDATQALANTLPKPRRRTKRLTVPQLRKLIGATGGARA